MTDHPAPTPASSPPPPRRRRLLRSLAAGLGGIVLLLFGLFVVNGTLLGPGERPVRALTMAPAAEPWGEDEPEQIQIVSWNIAKAFAYRGGLSFESTTVVRDRVVELARIIDAEQPDFVFLSESLLECGPCPVNQVRSIAEATGMHCWVFGENFNFGLPAYRVVGGNAILSRRPLEPVANRPLAGRQPFYITKNNRRMLWCAAPIRGKRVLLSAVHTDSFDSARNLEQTRQLLDFCAESPAILAGDFNANPGEPSVELLRDSGRWIGISDEPRTFPADAPRQRIDFILAPATWELVEERVLETQVSDHRPVVSTFRVRW